MERRRLRFDTLDAVVAEADRLVTAERKEGLASIGNWTLGQTLGHLAAWMNYPFDGYPPTLRPPWLVRCVGRLIRRRVLRKGMPAGVKIPRVPGGTFATERIGSAEGLERLRTAAARITSECPAVPNPMFGRLNHEEWVALNLRHAELHLGFFTPGKGT